MSDPTRMRDDESLLPGGREMLRAARPTRVMTRDERGRGAARVAKLAPLPLAGSAVLLWMKVVAAAAGLGIAGVVAVQVATPSTVTPVAAPTALASSMGVRGARANAPRAQLLEPDAPRAQLLEPAVPATPAAAATQLPVPATARAEPSLPLAAAPTAAREPSTPRSVAVATEAPTVDDLTREAALVEGARRSLETDPRDALRRVEEQARMFPRGQLADERELIAVDALRRLGRTTEARARAQALLHRDPSGLYGERVRNILAQLPAGT